MYHVRECPTRVAGAVHRAIRSFGEVAHVELLKTCFQARSASTVVDGGRMNRRARRKRETLRRIEDTGWRLFKTKGYEATSTREIAEAADIAAGTLFNYFPEKRSLLIHLMQHQIDEAVDQAFETLADASLEKQLQHVFFAITECYARERRLSRVFVKELLFTHGSQRADTAAWTFELVRRIAGLIREAQRRGELERAIDALDAAQQVFSVHYFGMVTWLGGTIPSRAAQEEQFRTALRLLFRGVRRHAA